MKAVVIATLVKDTGTIMVFGPFDSGEIASRWGHANLPEIEWYWEHVFAPSVENVNWAKDVIARES